MKRGSFYRAVGLPDCHLSGDDKDLHPAYLVARQYVLDIKPEVLVFMGDMGEFESMSSWNKKAPLKAEGKRYWSDVWAVSDELQLYRHYLPDTRMIYLCGNHEQRVQWYVEKNPEMEGFIDLPTDLGLVDLGIEWVRFNDYIDIGELAWTHGWYWNKYHANKTLIEFGGNVIYGHVHHFQMECRNLHFGKKQHIAQSLGCLTHRYPSWKGGKPTRFQNGFGTVEYREDGTFNINPHLIWKGEFSYGGRTWKA